MFTAALHTLHAQGLVSFIIGVGHDVMNFLDSQQATFQIHSLIIISGYRNAYLKVFQNPLLERGERYGRIFLNHKADCVHLLLSKSFAPTTCSRSPLLSTVFYQSVSRFQVYLQIQAEPLPVTASICSLNNTRPVSC